jgi:hypothetical protein
MNGYRLGPSSSSGAPGSHADDTHLTGRRALVECRTWLTAYSRSISRPSQIFHWPEGYSGLAPIFPTAMFAGL